MQAYTCIIQAAGNDLNVLNHIMKSYAGKQNSQIFFHNFKIVYENRQAHLPVSYKLLPNINLYKSEEEVENFISIVQSIGN